MNRIVNKATDMTLKKIQPNVFNFYGHYLFVVFFKSDQLDWLIQYEQHSPKHFHCKEIGDQ